MTPSIGNEEQTSQIYPLDDTAIAAVGELLEQRKTIEISLNAILSYFARIHKLQGVWHLAPNGRELVLQNGAK